jgi:hypothetical protein
MDANLSVHTGLLGLAQLGYTVDMIDIDRQLIKSFWSYKIAQKNLDI